MHLNFINKYKFILKGSSNVKEIKPELVGKSKIEHISLDLSLDFS